MAIARRRWLTFSLRGLLAALTLAALALGAWRAWLHPYEQQAQAAARFREMGAVVITENGSFAWARRLLGSERLQNVTSIDFASQDYDVMAVPITAVYALHRTDSQTAVTILQLTQLIVDVEVAESPQLNSVIVKACPGDQVMAREVIAALEGNEERLVIRDEEAGLLAPCRKLRLLVVSDSTFDDAALAHLTCRESLTELDLSGTRVTDRGLALLSEFRSLRVLLLERCKITDDGLRSLARCEQLESLSLAHTSVTDDGIEALVGLPQLKSLDLTGTKITPESLAIIDRFPQSAIKAVVDLTEIPSQLAVEHPRVTSQPAPEAFVQSLRAGSRREQLKPILRHLIREL